MSPRRSGKPRRASALAGPPGSSAADVANMARGGVAGIIESGMHRFARPAPSSAVHAGGGRPRGGARLPAALAQHAGDPAARAENPLDQRRKIQVRIELRPMQPQARCSDLDFGQFRVRRATEALCRTHGHAELDPAAEALYNSHEADLVASPALRAIGAPALIEADVPLALLGSPVGTVSSVARRSVVSRGCATGAHVEHEDSIVQPLSATRIRRVIRYPERAFLKLSGSGGWRERSA